MDPHKEEEDKAPPLGCEPKNLVEQAIMVSLHEQGKMNNMYAKGFDFCSSDVYLQPSDSWVDEKFVLTYEECKIKDNGEGK